MTTIIGFKNENTKNINLRFIATYSPERANLSIFYTELFTTLVYKFSSCLKNNWLFILK
jgi:hypothetical protein